LEIHKRRVPGMAKEREKKSGGNSANVVKVPEGRPAINSKTKRKTTNTRKD
jgi:hypothetical protein